MWLRVSAARTVPTVTVCALDALPVESLVLRDPRSIVARLGAKHEPSGSAVLRCPHTCDPVGYLGEDSQLAVGNQRLSEMSKRRTTWVKLQDSQPGTYYPNGFKDSQPCPASPHESPEVLLRFHRMTTR